MKRFLRLFMLLLVRILGAPAIMAAKRRAHQSFSRTPRILLLRPDHLGDLVLTTPALEALKTHLPGAEITMMVGPWSSEIVARHPALQRLIVCPFPGFQRAPQKLLDPYILLFRTAQQLRRAQYDLAINLRPDFWWGAALLYLAAIPHRVGYALQPGKPFLNETLPFVEREHATVSNLRLISEGLQVLSYPTLAEPFTPEAYPLRFEPTAQEQHWVTERLQESGIAPTDTLVVIHPGTGAAVKLWRNEAWSYCANALAARSTSAAPVRIILTGSRTERSLLEIIAQGMTQAPLMITDATVGQLAALLKRATLVLGVDSGPLHLAVAQSTKTVQIFGPTDAAIFGPWGSASEHPVITSRQRCPGCPAIPCGRLDFRPEEVELHPCVRIVPEQRVLDTIATLTNTAIIARTIEKL